MSLLHVWLVVGYSVLAVLRAASGLGARPGEASSTPCAEDEASPHMHGSPI